MARPREFEKTRELALRAAAVLEREGLGISTEQLAKEVGLKRPTFLYHFATHGHVVEIALADLLIQQAAYVESRVSKHTHPIDRLYARLCAVHEFHLGRETQVLFLTQAIAVTGGKRVAEIVKTASALFESSRQEMVERVEQGIKDGIVQPCDAKALIALLRSIIDGLTIQRVTSPETVDSVHTMFWKTVLEPLKRTPPKRKASKARR